MKPIAKYSALAAALLLAVVAVAAAVLVAVVDTEFIKAEASRAVREHTGRELAFAGDVRLSFFPWLGVDMDGVTLSNAPGFGDEPMIAARAIAVKVKLLPLLSGRAQVGEVVLDGLALRLGRDASGRTNLDDLLAPPARDGGAPGAPASPPPDAGGAKGTDGLGLLAIDGLRVSGATLAWDDRQAGASYAVTGLELTTGPLAPGQPVDVALRAALAADAPAVQADVDLSARLDPGPDFATLAVRGLRLNVEARGAAVPGGGARAALAGDLLADLKADTLALRGVTLAAYDIKAGIEGGVTRLRTAPALDATLTLDTFDPRALLAALELDAPATADPGALTRAALAVRAKADATALALSDLRLTVDDTELSGTASVRDFRRPALRFALAATALDADRYMPSGGAKAPAPGTEGGTKAPAPGPGDADGQGPALERLRSLDVDGTLDVAALTVAKVRMSDVRMTVKAKDGVLRVSPLSAGLYGGLLKAGLTADIRDREPRTSLDLGLADMGLGGLLADLLGQDRVTGTTALDLSLAATGSQWKSLLRSLSGKGSFALTDGAFKGFQIIPEAVRAQAAASDPQRRVEKAARQQRFKDITATFAIAKGVLTTGDTTLSADNLKGLGRGAVDLAAGTIDYKAVVDVTAVPRIPFTVRGALADPSVSLDTAEFVKGLALGVLGLPGKAGQGVLDTGKGALEGLGSGLRDLLGGGRKPKDGGQGATQP
ncbi:AsmA family protein [Desulfocurvus sp.]|uniref:AsmA family protein n=1 Tax=Desulfocurvus sp. TaxID=2871698 RepID=UPI0025C5C384|nr:AsmA family protein [Desulfocurvus sp.]MCK9239676.1 AsmA family protein [Desulfocurvus sp.]